MNIRAATPLLIAAACSVGLCACSSSPNLGGLLPSSTAQPAQSGAPAAADATGSTGTQPPAAGSTANVSPSVDKFAPAATGPNEDVKLGKKYFRSNNFVLAEKSFRSAVEKHPRDAEAWLGLAASCDRLHRFDLADRAYQQAIRLAGPTVEILNNEGFSYMLRGDYTRAHKTLEQAEAKDPANPYVAANMRLLEESYREGKAIQ
jgi:Flp pilus assembly protein TadD